MKIAIPKERRAGEHRVAASPDTVKKLVGLGFDVVVETGAGDGAAFTDAAFTEAGAKIAPSAAEAVGDADVIFKVQRPLTAEEGTDEVGQYKEGAILVGSLKALTEPALVEALAARKITSFAMELMPRITRAQSMDILSSQNNLAGYKAVIEAAATFNRAMPMMMTAAGTVPPARVLIFGAGVAGLQAVATAKRLGAVVFATDVRPATKEQVQSLGGKFVVVDEAMEKEAETAGGYAKEMPPEYFEKQKKIVGEHLTKADMVITTALIPGRKAPTLITAAQVETMKPGSVIVDLAAEAGGNCELTEPDQVVVKHGVTLIGHTNMPARLASDASLLFAKNLLNFLTPQVDKDKKALAINWDDDLIKGTLVTRDGQIVHPMLKKAEAEGGQ
ncbi:Re/Si-specific NAD(P)(+) transhydrogenase subunit alpha [Caenispirillum bisanense]|uniref:NAD(P) transhydrogenase subunit alpha part 1 n=1 Tax=Caenispirillum bisanense TaxID=414052 RepID=A0A286H143_9PROT|nr:Re/Si-specific NAD(P)(+) transhydrogenase subunit alpha [Caenispirillum bisanense]SOE01024.1 NAD(P) transhydrogenase subunit alpha [Caenispirillum bisanense]